MNKRRLQFIIDSLLRTKRGLVKPIEPDADGNAELLTPGDVTKWRRGMQDALM